MTPKVTVLIPVFNRERYVDDAIRSVIEQDFSDFELLIVDDGSTDGTADVLETWRQRDGRVVVVTSPANQGIPAALNLGLARARGTYVARLDSDDLMMPHRLAEQAAVLDARPDVVLVSCAYDIIDADGNYLGTWKGDEPHEVISFILNFFNIVGGGGQVMFRLEDVLAEGGYAPGYPSSEDYDLWVRLLRRGRIETLPFVGMRKRSHSNQSVVRWRSVKHASWTAIMRSALEGYLHRAVSDEEIAALITVWRLGGELGRDAIADAVMVEAFSRFRVEVRDRSLQRSARRKIARQWYVAAKHLAKHRHGLESARYLARSVLWAVSRGRAAAASPTTASPPGGSR